MSESEAQIWCETGQLMVNLPKQAFDKSLTSSGATITPCDGCSHSGHVKKVIQIESEVETAT